MNISIQKHSGSVILRPRVTEKAAFAAEKNQYIFEVSKDATKASVSKAIQEMYKVTPIAVNIIRTAIKKIVIRGKRGTKPAIKKAIVSLKKGDKIEIA